MTKKTDFIQRILIFTVTLLILWSIPVETRAQAEEETAKTTGDFELAKNLDIYYSLMRELDILFVDSIDPGKLIKTSIDAMLKTLDPYTVYIPESRMEDYKFMTTGQYGGIGALIQKKGDYVMISTPYEGFPAQKAGLTAGDVILKVDGKSVKGKSVKDLSSLLKGEPGTEITLEVRRLGKKEPFEVRFKREKIKMKSVPYYGMLNDSIGYIKLNQFTLGCGKDVKNALKTLKEENHLKGLVFDLRNNPGGLLIEAINVVNAFVSQGQQVVSTKGRISQWERTYKTPQHAVDTAVAIAVLVNSGSASASEIVSGSIQDLDRGVIVGTRSYGKGLVQSTRDLPYNSKLKLTIAKYYIPSGRCIQALDYSHRNADGSVGHVPDSLMTPFKTKHGRTVYDGGGILPDTVLTHTKWTPFTRELIVQQVVFDFATHFYVKHDSIPIDFTIDDATWSAFKTYLDSIDFSYETRTEKVLDDLEKQSKKEKYYDALKDEFAKMHTLLKQDRSNDLEKNKQDVTELLQEEIMSRYYYQKGRIKASLSFDKDTKVAMDILENPQLYHAILSGAHKANSAKK